MSKNLVIVESPAKAKTIGRYLGKDYDIVASVGHIRDLPPNQKGVDVNNNYKVIYIPMAGKAKVIKELKEKAAQSDFVYIATDPDREGEAIAWHLAQILKIDSSSSCRITFNEITKNAVQEAIRNPRAIDLDLVDAQQARRVLDRLVGYELSPLLWKKVKKKLSAGRVQSVASKIVMDRDNEIDAFVPEEYWTLTALVTPDRDNEAFKVTYHGVNEDGKIRKVKLSCKEDVEEVKSRVDSGSWKVTGVKKGSRDRNPMPPFTTSTLQQEASRRLSFTSRKTMSVAQQLYEGIEIAGLGHTALVSYIRTDSVRVSDEAVAAARSLIFNEYGEEYLCKYNRQYKNKNQAQDAHEAIRPTHFDLSPKSIKNSLTSDQYRLYKLIWDRFLATQMAAAKIDTLNVEVACGTDVFRTSGETVRFKGFLVLYSDIKEDSQDDDSEDKPSNAILPPLAEGQAIRKLGLDGVQKFTQPPAHYTEATLIKAMEEYGIGRPSTYAPTVGTILEKNYVAKDGKFLKITELGRIVTNLLSDNFSEIVDVKFTAGMEEALDDIESGKKEWTNVVDEFYPSFHEQVEKAMDTVEKVVIEPVKTGEECPLCGAELVMKDGKYGQFIACSNFPTCKFTKNVEVKAKGTCPYCGSGLLTHKSKKYRNKTFYTCDKKGKDPDCGFISWDLPVEGKTCSVCGSYMVWKRYGKKTYPRCSNKECSTNLQRASSGRKKAEDKEEGQDGNA